MWMDEPRALICLSWVPNRSSKFWSSKQMSVNSVSSSWRYPKHTIPFLRCLKKTFRLKSQRDFHWLVYGIVLLCTHPNKKCRNLLLVRRLLLNAWTRKGLHLPPQFVKQEICRRSSMICKMNLSGMNGQKISNWTKVDFQNTNCEVIRRRFLKNIDSNSKYYDSLNAVKQKWNAHLCKAFPSILFK